MTIKITRQTVTAPVRKLNATWTMEKPQTLPGRGWYAEVWLDDNEWPSVDEKEVCLDRPIRSWVLDQCAGNTWFTCAGIVLFEREDDLMMFQLVWG